MNSTANPETCINLRHARSPAKAIRSGRDAAANGQAGFNTVSFSIFPLRWPLWSGRRLPSSRRYSRSDSFDQ
jgi:hypothetical protein